MAVPAAPSIRGLSVDPCTCRLGRVTGTEGEGAGMCVSFGEGEGWGVRTNRHSQCSLTAFSWATVARRKNTIREFAVALN